MRQPLMRTSLAPKFVGKLPSRTPKATVPSRFIWTIPAGLYSEISPARPIRFPKGAAVRPRQTVYGVRARKNWAWLVGASGNTWSRLLTGPFQYGSHCTTGFRLRVDSTV